MSIFYADLEQVQFFLKVIEVKKINVNKLKITQEII